MHVLLTNDDGPLDNTSCPYMKYLVDEITLKTDWEVSIVVPNQQRSWIGKAHFAGKTLTASYIYTKVSTQVDNKDINAFEGPFTTRQLDKAKPEYQEWALIDSTPAACADIGIHHLYPEKPPVDLVISGPNFGKNSSNLYILASGTVGAAMEAVTHGIKALAFSYAFNNLDHDFTILKEAAKISVKLAKTLYKELQESDDIDLFSVNVPLVDSLKLGQTKIHYAPIFQNQWNSIYAPVEQDGIQQYSWQPDFKKVYKDGLKDNSHTDSRVLLDEGVSVTPLKATFNVVAPHSGEITLEGDEEEGENVLNGMSSLSVSSANSSRVILITLPKLSYIYPAILESIQSNYPSISITNDPSVLKRVSDDSSLKVFHYGDYEELDIDLLSSNPEQYFVCSYIYRKALIRKHFLANTIHHYVVKNPELKLISAAPESYQLEVDYAEFLDDALDDCYELREELESGEKTWILKPSMSDKGQGIRIFQTVDQLQEIFNLFEINDSDEEDDIADQEENNGVIISQLRHFIVQEYQSEPLLLEQYENKKFHLRVYVVCFGDLQVYVYENILTLFAGESFKQVPTKSENDVEEISLDGHLTNTCLQEGREPLVVPFWDLEGISALDKTAIFKQVCDVTGELFKAAVNIDKMNFQPLNNGLEIFGVDFLVNRDLQVKLLEVNSYPDFKQTGEDLKGLIYGLFEEVNGLVGELIDVKENKEKRAKSKLISVMHEGGKNW